MTLESFDAEAPLSAGTPRAEVSLSEIAAAGGVDVWSEAVAVVEELCGLLTQDGREARVPALEDVLLNAQGQLRIVYGGGGERGPVGTARLLTALLGGTDVPVQVRLFLSQATAPDTHGSIGEFATALAYFGRPDRTELIQGLYKRFASRPLDAGTAAAPPPLPQDPFGPKRDAAAKPRRRRSVRIPPAAWVAVALLVVLGAGAWLMNGGDRTPSTTAADVAGAMTGAFDDLTATARELMGEARIVPAEADGGTADREAPEATVAGGGTAAQRPTPAATRPPASGGGSVAAGPSAAAASTPSVSAPTTPPASPRSASAVSASASPGVAPPTAEAAVSLPRPRETPVEVVAASVVDTGIIYSREDADVVPPELLAPQLPQPLVTVEDREPTVNRMEVVVARDGTVERVRLLAGPRRMPDMMLLSGAKTWRFEPAQKDGVPVRYRTILSWQVTP